jgi:DNA-binding transcriptional LysR family regulator
MEMHQVRYFLAVAQTLNFTRAAEMCHVAQPSLTRAIKQLEAELGGDLFRRERPPQMTDLGQKMLPLLRQCYESAVSAKSIATAVRKGEINSLSLAISRTVDLSLIIPHLIELRRAFRGLNVKLLRGSGPEIAELLKNGDAELGVASTIGDGWDRFDRWTLFEEPYLLAMSPAHRLANRTAIDIDDLRNEPLLVRSYCENTGRFVAILRERGIEVAHWCEISSERDLMMLIEANAGVALVPRSAEGSPTLMRSPINGKDFCRTVYLYGVAGRERTTVVNAIMKMLRGMNWSRYLT